MAPKKSKGNDAPAANGIGGLIKGSPVWVCRDGRNDWQLGEIKSDPTVDPVTVQLQLKGETAAFPAAQLAPANPDFLDGIPDLTQLSHLNEPSLLHNLRHRFAEDLIYTFAGPVLVAVNPCKQLQLYTPEVANQYKMGAREAGNNLKPHIYLVAANAYRGMERDGHSQSLVISGESGAGKTETTKKAMQYFASLAGGNGIEEQVLQSNPILEAFGNAKTLRNPNSSRFGKLIQIHFNHTHHICGASIATYLLEKSRVVARLPGERSYHIFYQLIKGASPELRAQLRLPDSPEAMEYLQKSGCMEIAYVDDAKDFQDVISAMQLIGIGEEQRTGMFALLAGILWLGNVTFELSDDEQGSKAVRDAAFTTAAELLGVSADQLETALTIKILKTRGESLPRQLKVAEAGAARDALAKAIYASLFEHLVAAINANLAAGRKAAGLSISILDIFGFEMFDSNSFEQLCINYANERLQQQFNRHLFTLEQEEYAAEGLDWTHVEFVDNQPCVDLIDAASKQNVSILRLLDEQCKLPKGSDGAFLERLRQSFKDSPHMSFHPLSPQDFIVRHFAGQVQYDSQGFLEKNRDTLNNDLLELMMASTQPLLKVLGEAILAEMTAPPPAAAAASNGPAKRGPGGGAAAPQAPTVGGRFSRQMRELISTLDGTGLHFVRCIKPNDKLKPDTFSVDMILHQLRCAGVLEVVRIAQAGYPTRYPVAKFVKRYNVLLTGLDTWQTFDDDTPFEAAKKLLSQFGMEPAKFKLGKTKIFFRSGSLSHIEDRWANLQRLAVLTQACFRRWAMQWWFQKHRRAAIRMQSSFRALHARRAYKYLRRELDAARAIQRAWRAHRLRLKFLAVVAGAVAEKVRADAARLTAATTLQASYRSLRARRLLGELRRGDRAARVIQGAWRPRRLRNRFRGVVAAAVESVRFAVSREKAATHLQASYRGLCARRLLGQLQKQNDAARVIQSAWRARMLRAKLRGIVGAAVAENLRVVRERAATQLQGAFRALRARRLLQQLQQLRRQNDAASVVQKAWRAHRLRLKFTGVVAAAVAEKVRSDAAQAAAATLLQSLFRALCARRALQQLRSQHVAAGTVQKAWRAHRLRMKLISIVTAAVAEKSLDDLARAAAATVLQSYIRALFARRTFQLLRAQHVAAGTVQKAWRKHRLRLKLISIVTAAAAEKARSDLARAAAAAVFQSSFRALCARRALKQLRSRTHAVALIQKAWRAHRLRLKFIGVVDAAAEQKRAADRKIGFEAAVAVQAAAAAAAAAAAEAAAAAAAPSAATAAEAAAAMGATGPAAAAIAAALHGAPVDALHLANGAPADTGGAILEGDGSLLALSELQAEKVRLQEENERLQQQVADLLAGKSPLTNGHSNRQLPTSYDAALSGRSAGPAPAQPDRSWLESLLSCDLHGVDAGSLETLFELAEQFDRNSRVLEDDLSFYRETQSSRTGLRATKRRPWFGARGSATSPDGEVPPDLLAIMQKYKEWRRGFQYNLHVARDISRHMLQDRESTLDNKGGEQAERTQRREKDPMLRSWRAVAVALKQLGFVFELWRGHFREEFYQLLPVRPEVVAALQSVSRRHGADAAEAAIEAVASGSNDAASTGTLTPTAGTPPARRARFGGWFA